MSIINNLHEWCNLNPKSTWTARKVEQKARSQFLPISPRRRPRNDTRIPAKRPFLRNHYFDSERHYFYFSNASTHCTIRKLLLGILSVWKMSGNIFLIIHNDAKTSLRFNGPWPNESISMINRSWPATQY